MTKTLVFDLDGTLISCRPRQIAALRAVSGLSRVDLSTIWLAKRDGLSTRTALQAVGVSAKQSEKLSNLWGRVIETPYFLSYDRLLPRATDALSACRTRGLRTVILTARRSQRFAMMQCNALRLNGMVDDILIVDPRDGAAQKAAALRQLSPCALIGDSEVDAKAAATASVPFIPVSSGQRSSEFFDRTMGLSTFDDVLAATLFCLGKSDI